MLRLRRLRDNQWDWIKDILPGRVGSVGVTAADNRLFVDAVLSIAIEPASLGATCRMTWAVGKTSIGASAVGPNAVCGPRYLAF